MWNDAFERDLERIFNKLNCLNLKEILYSHISSYFIACVKLRCCVS